MLFTLFIYEPRQFIKLFCKEKLNKEPKQNTKIPIKLPARLQILYLTIWPNSNTNRGLERM